MEFLRTPDERFTDLPDFPWEPRYVEVHDPDTDTGGGRLRLAYVEDGPADGETVLLESEYDRVHGVRPEVDWRRMGCRCGP